MIEINKDTCWGIFKCISMLSYPFNTKSIKKSDISVRDVLLTSDKSSILLSCFEAEIKSPYSANSTILNFLEIGSITTEPNRLMIIPMK